MIALALVLAACGPSESTPPAQQGPPAPDGAAATAQPADPATGACALVFTAADANAVFAAGRALQGLDADCTFEDVHVKGSTLELAFELPDDTKVPATLEIAACLASGPPAGAFTAGPYALIAPPASEARCPKGFAALRAAIGGADFPQPSAAR